MTTPKISIVTPSYNQGRFLEETIDSVLSQNYPNLEYVIMDGGSTDESVEIIKKYQDHLKFWVSERDKGQGDAINKGLTHCTGEIFNWLNSDDYLEPNALKAISAAFTDTNADMVAGSVRNFSSKHDEFVQNGNLSAEGLMTWKPGVKFVQPGVWMRRSLMQDAGGIDQQFHYAFDWDLYIRYLYKHPFVAEIPDLLVHFRLHDESKTQAFGQRFAHEEMAIIKKLHDDPAFSKLKNVADYKLQKAGWTEFLSQQSSSSAGLVTKIISTLRKMKSFPKVSYTRQTAGAIKAFVQKRSI